MFKDGVKLAIPPEGQPRAPRLLRGARTHLRLAGRPNETLRLLCFVVFQERLVLSVLPRFVVLEMINDMTNVEDEHLQHQFHRIYIHRYENVR